MDEAVGEPIWSLPPDTLKLTQALPSPGWEGRCQAEFTQVLQEIGLRVRFRVLTVAAIVQP